MNASTRNNDDGVALLLVLLFIVLLAAIVTEYAYEMRVEAAFVSNHVAEVRACAAARSAVAMGQSLLILDAENRDGYTGTEFDALDDPWALGIPYEEVEGAVVRCTVNDEYGKINLNAIIDSSGNVTNPDMEAALRALFIARGAEVDPVDAILDWIDSDDESRSTGAEADYYESQKTSFGIRNGPLGSVEELLMIRGITPELFFGETDVESNVLSEDEEMLPLTELLTVHGEPDGKINVNTAPKEVLAAVCEGLDKFGAAETAIQERENLPYENVEDAELRIFGGPRDPNPPQGQDAETWPVVVASDTYRIHGDGLMNESKVRIEAYVYREASDQAGGPVTLRVLDWREMR